MSNTFTYDLPLIQNGDTIILKAFANCRSKFSVRLVNKKTGATIGDALVKDSNEELYKELQTLHLTYAQSDLLTLVVTSEENRNITAQVHTGTLFSKNGIAGSTYTICIEDETDNDFNDIYITLGTWKGGR